uniref:HEPN domain-containing protein n=1 Tax=Rhodopseudomonas palustris (strain BisA53) TaxID=316055 RepID=Q07UD1_RHOP5
MTELEDRLLVVARDLCRRTGKRPREAFMRRAVSSAYYAVFHALCRLCADTIIGGIHHKSQAWQRVYRGVSHTGAKAVLTSSKELSAFPAEVADFGVAFVLLQKEREQADYSSAPFEKYFAGTESLVEQAANAIVILGKLEDAHRRALAAALLVKARTS